MNYTSCLLQDNDNASADSPPYWPQSYSLPAMLSYLDASSPMVSNTGGQYTYSSLGFALMAAILSGSPSNLAAFADLMHSNIFVPLGMKSTFFDAVSLARLPLGYEYDYQQSPVFEAIAPWLEFLSGLLWCGWDRGVAKRYASVAAVQYGDQSVCRADPAASRPAATFNQRQIRQ
jgi:CubicO group peptidase (beta-lactamase class C family)